MIKTDITVAPGFSESDIKYAITEKIGIGREEIKTLRIVRSHLEFSDKANIKYKLTVAIEASPEREAGLLKMRKKVAEYSPLSYEAPISRLALRPVVVGAGPAGLFCALTLAEAGAMPIVIERGEAVDARMSTVSSFFKGGKLNTESNIQFGEGGAGAFSDGKLKVGSYDKYKMKVLTEFFEHGADESVTYSSSAHVGTDRLPGIIKSIREKIISLGGEFRFSTKLVGIKICDGKVRAARVLSFGKEEEISTDRLILATGHSAQDVFIMLEKLGAHMQAKGFGIGMRVEHSREYINTVQYGKDRSSELPTASYHLVTHLPSGRSVYSFCMCPGGSVVAATSEEGCVVTNGMSEYMRNGDNSNAAILVSVTPDDFDSTSPLSGIALQRRIEKSAFSAAGSCYRAPAQRMDAFMREEGGEDFASVKPTYQLGVERINADIYLPRSITNSIREAIPDFDAWMGGFYHPDAVFTGAETRSTSPVRVLRTESLEAVGIEGLYPAGEGAGYAGGIVSSAVDGIKCAEAALLK